LHSASTCRYDNSLGKVCNDSLKVGTINVCFLLIIFLLPGLLTKKFIHLLRIAEDGNLDLNKAAEILEVWFSIQQKKMLCTVLVVQYFELSVVWCLNVL
jgi:hypothetical protein